MEHRPVDDHLAGLRVAVGAFVAAAGAAGPAAAVPTCPAWTVRQLVAHQGMVHRWARATLLGQRCHPPDWDHEGQRVEDPLAWLGEGADALAATVGEVPDDVRAAVFLKDAPAPRVFWARRQCHETTIHAADAVAASLGHAPAPHQVGWIDEAVALDGIDELLTGFVTRGRSRFAGAGPRTFEVRPRGCARRWSVQIGEDGAVRTTRLGGSSGEPDVADATRDATLEGSAVGLYLALWNRAAPGAVDDPDRVLDLWSRRARVRWS